MRKIQNLLGAMLLMLPLMAGAETKDSVQIGTVVDEVVWIRASGRD